MKTGSGSCCKGCNESRLCNPSFTNWGSAVGLLGQLISLRGEEDFVLT